MIMGSPISLLPDLGMRSGLYVLACSLLIAANGCSANQTDLEGTPGIPSATDLYYDPPESRPAVNNLKGPDLVTGALLDLDGYNNRVVVINIWGTWCTPCQADEPELTKIFTRYKPEKLQVLGINVRESQETEARLATTHHVPYPSIADPDLHIVQSALHDQISTIPTTIVLDRQHRVAARFVRTINATELKPLLDQLIDD